MSITARNIYLEVPEYNFEDESKGAFIGRLAEREKLKRKITPPCLTDNEENLDNALYQGSYLIAGYRGIGKSTLVKKVHQEISEELSDSLNQRKLHVIDVYLSQGELSDFDLLRQMFIQLKTEIEKDIKPLPRLGKILTALFVGLTMAFSFGFTVFNLNVNELLTDPVLAYPKYIKSNQTLALVILSLLFIFSYTLCYRLTSYISRGLNPLGKTKQDLKNKLEQTNRRIHSGLEVSNGNNSIEDSGIETSLLNKFLSSFNHDDSKLYKQSFNRITVKELEFEIKEILRTYKRLKKGYVLFIIDELDKLEPEFSYEAENIIELGKSKVQTRRDSVAKLLANLKSFIHTADAKFVFIGGAEMYDASLADIADRESFYSSIFHEVIYINSFFKDWVESKKGLSQMTEDYIIRNLIVNKKNADRNLQLEIDDYYRRLQNISEKDRFFVIYQLRRFIIFLTYRSNGSPKRLKELFESYLHQSNSNLITSTEKKDKLVIHFDKDELFSTEPNLLKKDNKGKKRTYLRLDYIEQYHIGFLYNIVTPYLLSNQKHFKLFSDRNLYLSAFLLDHILKFHRSAFSWRELELMPDIILGSKGPNLREMMGSIMTYLSGRHFIRETNNAMFQYKFRSRAAMEFRYISKISDENAAAFNFTYDESYHLKTFFKQKLKQKRLAYNSDSSNDSNLSITISYLNSTIADLHFYDEEYESAIRYYNDSFEPLNKNRKKLNNDDSVKFLTNRLMVSLCLEKTYRFGNTYSALRDTIIEIYTWGFDVFNDKNRPSQYPWEAPYKRMQLFLRPHLALLASIEKGRSDGITESNLRRNIQEYCEFMGLKNLFPLESFKPNLGYRDFFHDSNRLGDHKRVQTLLADYYQNIGSILFYKNRNFNSIHQKGAYGVWFEFLKIKNLDNTLIHSDVISRNGIPRPSDFTILDLNTKCTDVWGLRYASINNIREVFEIHNSYFFPSYSCTFYYITAIGHLLSPYRENLYTVFNDIDFAPFEQSDIIFGCFPYIEDGVAAYNYYTLTSTWDHFKTSSASASSALKMYKTIETVLYRNNALHILSGKTAQSLGLTLSKLADGILSCLGNRSHFSEAINSIDSERLLQQIPNFESSNNESIYWFEFWKLQDFDNLNSILFGTYFSITNVFYLNIISFRAFQLGGLYNDALFQLKKNLYLLNTYCEDFITENGVVNEDNIEFVKFFKDWLVAESSELIKTHINKDIKVERDFIDSVTNAELTTNTHTNRLFSMDDEEISYLTSQIEIKTSANQEIDLKKKLNEIDDNLNFIDNVYTRIQELRYNNFVRFKRIQPFISELHLGNLSGVRIHKRANNLTDIIFSFKNSRNDFLIEKSELFKAIDEIHTCCKNLLNITSTYGISYIMTYSYLGSLNKNIYKMSCFMNKLEKNITSLVSQRNSQELSKLAEDFKFKERWTFQNADYYRRQATDNFTKAVNLHSEGIEYKSMIQNMYILEDDFNDLLVHFCAALERSLVNTGVIEKKLNFN